MEQTPISSGTDRKTMEKNRRSLMKSLFSELNSIVPQQSSREARKSHPDQLDEAANYIKKLSLRIEKMKENKERLLLARENQEFNHSKTRNGKSLVKIPKIEIHEKGSALEVCLITGMNYLFIFNETIRILHEEGVEVINASFSVLDGRVFHTIHSKVGGAKMNNDMQIARISERLKNFVYGASLVIIM